MPDENIQSGNDTGKSEETSMKDAHLVELPIENKSEIKEEAGKIEKNQLTKTPGESSFKLNGKLETVCAQIINELPKIIPAFLDLKTEEYSNMEVESFKLDVKRSRFAPFPSFEGHVNFHGKGFVPGKKPKKFDFFVKCFVENLDRGFPPSDETSQRFLKPLEKEKMLYDLMQGSEVVPKAFWFEKLENMLFLEYAGEQSAEEKLYNPKDPEQNLELEDRILKNIAKFNLQTLRMTPFAISSFSPLLKSKKPEIDQAKRYLKQYLKSQGKPISEESLREFEANYSALIEMYSLKESYKPSLVELEYYFDQYLRKYCGKSLSEEEKREFKANYSAFVEKQGNEEDRLVHGDLGRQNIVGPKDNEWTEKNIKIVDLGSMRFGDPIFSVAQFVTSIGSKANPERWNSLLASYMTHDAALSKGVVISNIRFNPHSILMARKIFYTAAIHYSLRGLSKMAQLKEENPASYYKLTTARPVLKEWHKSLTANISNGLAYILNNPAAFELDDGQESRLKNLSENFKGLDIIT